MSDKITEFTFTLEVPVEYGSNGQLSQTNSFILVSPKGKDIPRICKLREYFFNSISVLQQREQNKIASQESKNESDEMPVMVILSMAKTDTTKFVQIVKDILFSGGCMIDTQQRLTSNIYDKMEASDCDNLLEEYIKNFMMSSWLKILKKN